MATNTWVELPKPSGGSGSGVSSLNALTGAVVLAAGSGISITPSGNTLTIAATGSSPTGTPNTFAGFDGLGALESVPGFQIDTTSGGMNEALTEQPNDGGGFTVNTFSTQFDPLQDSPNETWNIQSIQAFMDVNNSGFNQGINGTAVSLLNLGFTHHGTGNTGALNYLNLNSDIGNGTDPITVKGMGYFLGFDTVHANVTIDGLIQGYGFQPAVDVAAIGTSAFGVNAFYDFANIQIPVHGYTSFAVSPNILEIANNSNYNGVSVNPVIPTFTGNAGILGYNFSPQIATTGSTGQIQGLNLNPAVTTMGSSSTYTGINVGGQITTMGSSSSYNGVSVSGNITTSHGNIQGLVVNPVISGGDASLVGLIINPQGGATLSDPKAVSINMSQVNSTNPQGMVGIESDSRLSINATTQLKSAQTFQIGSRIEHAFIVPAGSPVTGTDEIAMNLAGDFLVQDDVANGAFGIGFNSVGFISSMAVAATKTVDSATVFLPAASFPDPGFTTGGNITDFHIIRTFPPLPQGGTVNITNLYGFKIDSSFGDFGSAASNAWGLFIDGSAQNYIASSLAIDTATTKVSNSSVGLEIGGTTKALKLPELTTAQRDSLTALSGMQIFNTDTLVVEFYDGTSWVSGGGSGGASETAIINETQVSGTAGGTGTVSTWNTRILNTVQTPQSWLSLSSNQFTLQPGTYQIYATAPASQVQIHKSKLYDITNTADVLIGSSEYSGFSGGVGAQSESIIAGQFTVLSPTTFEIQHNITVSTGTQDFGIQSSFASTSEVYTQVEITKIDTPSAPIVPDITPKWTKYTVTYTDLAAASMTNDAPLTPALAIGPKQYVSAAVIKTSVEFTGGGATSYGVTVGSVVSGFSSLGVGYDAFLTASDTNFTVNGGSPPYIYDFGASTPMRIQATSDVNLDQITQGSLDVWVLISTLP